MSRPDEEHENPFSFDTSEPTVWIMRPITTMNRSKSADSKLSLDDEPYQRDCVRHDRTALPPLYRTQGQGPKLGPVLRLVD